MIRAAARTSPAADRHRLQAGWEDVMRAGGEAVGWVLEQQMGFLRGVGEGVVGIGQGLSPWPHSRRCTGSSTLTGNDGG